MAEGTTTRRKIDQGHIKGINMVGETLNEQVAAAFIGVTCVYLLLSACTVFQAVILRVWTLSMPLGTLSQLQGKGQERMHSQESSESTVYSTS